MRSCNVLLSHPWILQSAPCTPTTHQRTLPYQALPPSGALCLRLRMTALDRFTSRATRPRSIGLAHNACPVRHPTLVPDSRDLHSSRPHAKLAGNTATLPSDATCLAWHCFSNATARIARTRTPSRNQNRGGLNATKNFFPVTTAPHVRSWRIIARSYNSRRTPLTWNWIGNFYRPLMDPRLSLTNDIQGKLARRFPQHYWTTALLTPPPSTPASTMRASTYPTIPPSSSGHIPHHDWEILPPTWTQSHRSARSTHPSRQPHF